LNNSNYSTAVGVYAKCTGSNQIVLGTSNETTYIPGNLTARGNTNFTGGVFSYGSNFYVQGCVGTFNNGLSVLNAGININSGGTYVNQGDLTVYGGNINFNNFIGGISKTVFNYLSGATSNIQNQLNTLFSLTPPGTIIMYVSTSTALSGYLSCDGSEVSKAIYANLYNAIQDIYGAPSNPTNFKLPNFQGLFLRGTGSQKF